MPYFQYYVVGMGKESFFHLLISITSPFLPINNYNNKSKKNFSNYSRNKYLMQVATALNNPR